MFRRYFGIKENPFSNTPDPHYLFMSDRHREALAHLQYGAQGGSGFVLLTGEVGTGKTTVCRCLVEQLPDHIDLALCLNPRLTEFELVASICDELAIDTAFCVPDSIKDHMDVLNKHLLQGYAKGRRAVLIIDEAQNLGYSLLEQVRLLTNLETASSKLLQVILIGQPELRTRLDQSEMRQLSQRITARYHLEPMTRGEADNYIRHRLQVGGLPADLFGPSALTEIHARSNGIPRLINSICERSLLGAYAAGKKRIDGDLARAAAREVLGDVTATRRPRKAPVGLAAGAALAAAAGIGIMIGVSLDRDAAPVPSPSAAMTENREAVPATAPSAAPPDAGPEAGKTLAAVVEPAAAAPEEPASAATLESQAGGGTETASPPLPEQAAAAVPAPGPDTTSDEVEAIARLLAAGSVTDLEPTARPPAEAPAAAADGAADRGALAAALDPAAGGGAETASPPPEAAPTPTGDAAEEAIDVVSRLLAQGLVTTPEAAAPVTEVASRPSPEPAAARPETAGGPAAAASLPPADETPTAADPTPPPTDEKITLENLFRHPDIGGATDGAIARLFQLWKRETTDLTGFDPCADAEKVGLKCYQRRGTWAKVESINRPSLIRLVNGEGKRKFAVVSAIDGRRVTLDIDGHEIPTNADAIAPFWRGDFLVLWEPLPHLRRNLRSGMKGKDVAWLRSRLAEILGAAPGTGEPSDPGNAGTFDAELEKQVITYQQSRRLEGDGVVGTLTRIQLGTELGRSNVPRLRNEP